MIVDVPVAVDYNFTVFVHSFIFVLCFVLLSAPLNRTHSFCPKIFGCAGESCTVHTRTVQCT